MCLEVIKLTNVVVVEIKLTRVVVVEYSFLFSFSLNPVASIINSFSLLKRLRVALELFLTFLNLFRDFLEIIFLMVGRKLPKSNFMLFSVVGMSKGMV